MNHMQIARRLRSAFSGRAVKAAAVAGVAAVALGTAGSAYASTGTHVRPNGWSPVEECLNWSGTIQYFPALTTTSHPVTAVISGTASNCSLDGTGQAYSASVFGVLTGSGVKSGITLSGNVAVTWPADASLSPSIAPIAITKTGTQAYQFYGMVNAGAFTGAGRLQGSYDVISMQKVTGGNKQNILGSAPFGIWENFG